MKICTHDDKCKALLIEDHPDHADLVTRIITLYGKDGFTVCLHKSLADGLQCIANHKNTTLDIILLDLFLPDSKGLITLESVIRAAPDVPIVVLTSLSDESLAEQAIDAGAQDYVVKDEVMSGGRSLDRIMRYSIARNRNRIKSREQQRKLEEAENILEDSKALTLVKEVKEELAVIARRGY